MTNTYITTREDGKLAVTSPYNRDFIDDIKMLGGKWDRTDGVWVVSEGVRPQVSDLLSRYFGWAETEGVKHAVLITLSSDRDLVDKLVLAGQIVAEKRYRDGYPSLAAGVAVVDGKFDYRGGSAKYPRLTFDGPITIRVEDLTDAQIENIRNDQSLADTISEIVVVRDDTDKALKSLYQEREHLLAQLEAIEKAIAEKEGK